MKIIKILCIIEEEKHENGEKNMVTSDISYKKKQRKYNYHSINKIENFSHFFIFAYNKQKTILSLYIV